MKNHHDIIRSLSDNHKRTMVLIMQCKNTLLNRIGHCGCGINCKCAECKDAEAALKNIDTWLANETEGEQ